MLLNCSFDGMKAIKKDYIIDRVKLNYNNVVPYCESECDCLVKPCLRDDGKIMSGNTLIGMEGSQDALKDWEIEENMNN